MSLPSSVLTTTCDIYRPFGAASPLYTGVACQLVADLAGGRSPLSSNLAWTHYLLVNETVDIRDGCTRTAGSNAITYADGDKVVIPAGGGNTSYVVVWVEYVLRGQVTEHKRAYLMRASATWPGP